MAVQFCPHFPFNTRGAAPSLPSLPCTWPPCCPPWQRAWAEAAAGAWLSSVPPCHTTTLPACTQGTPQRGCCRLPCPSCTAQRGTWCRQGSHQAGLPAHLRWGLLECMRCCHRTRIHHRPHALAGCASPHALACYPFSPRPCTRRTAAAPNLWQAAACSFLLNPIFTTASHTTHCCCPLICGRLLHAHLCCWPIAELPGQ